MVICYYLKEYGRIYPGYEGLYQVSNTGQVKSLNYKGTGKTKILKQGTSKHGYKKVVLYKNKKRKTYLVHRLIAQTFISNPNNWPQVNHKDENKTNNVAWNLEWCTSKYNNNYGTCRERMIEKQKGKYVSKETKRKLSKSFKGKNRGKDNVHSKPIIMLTLDGEFIRRFDSIADAVRFLNKNNKCSGNIIKSLKNANRTAYGSKWKYEEDCK